MTPEEKAKRYDEALKMAKSIIKNDKDHVLYEDDIIEIFPELKESEDEKIKKELTEFLKSTSGGFLDTAIPCKTYGKWVVWLEKQENFNKKDVDDAYLKGVSDTKNEIEKQYEANYQIRKDIATFIFNYKGDIKDRAKWMNYLGIKVSFVEKQDEQKTAWSEDEKIKKDLIQWINEFPDTIWRGHYKKDVLAWLEKQGGQKPAWSEEDEKMVKDIIASIDALCYHGMVNWLKSLKERIG